MNEFLSLPEAADELKCLPAELLIYLELCSLELSPGGLVDRKVLEGVREIQRFGLDATLKESGRRPPSRQS